MSEVTTSDAAARVQLIPVPIASPGSCALCGKSNHPEGFATGDNLDFEFHGTFYLCGDCVGDFARLFGWIHPKVAQTFTENAEEQAAYIAALEMALDNLEEVENAINDYIGRNPISSNDSNGTVFVSDSTPTTVNDEQSNGLSGNESEQLNGDNKGSTESESDANQSVTEQRPSSVSSITSDVAELLA